MVTGAQCPGQLGLSPAQMLRAGSGKEKVLPAAMQAAGPADGEGGHTAISRSLFSSPTPNIMKCFSIRKRLWLSFSAVAIHSAANELPRGAGGLTLMSPSSPTWSCGWGPTTPGSPALQALWMGSQEQSVLCEGQCQAKGGWTASSQAEPVPANRAACTHGSLCALQPLKGSVFGLTVNEEITYSPEYLS